MKILLGGIVAGIVVFIWGAIAHMVLPLGMAGLNSLPNDEMVMGVMRENLTKPGLYYFPGMATDRGLSKERKEAEQKAFAEKYRRGPSGLLVYTPAGKNPFAPTQLVLELLSNIAGAIVAAFLLAQARLASFGARVGFVTLLGLFAWLAIEVSYWNWYGFPRDYTLAQLVDQVVGWFLGGLVLGKILK